LNLILIGPVRHHLFLLETFLQTSMRTTPPLGSPLMVTIPRPGATATVEAVVGAGDTAAALGSGDVPVLGTPMVLALLERATVEAVAGQLAPSRTTVGARVALDHLRPTRVGATVVAAATLTEVDGRRLVFDVRLTEAGETAARGTIVRVLVDRDRFAGG
jgi:predicted thioesterase